MLEALLSPLSSLLGKTWEQFAKTKNAKRLNDALRDRLKREVWLNLEILQFFDPKIVDSEALANVISTDAFEAVCKLNIPLWLVFDKNGLPPKASELLRTGSSTDARFVQWADSIKSEVDLVERIWHRLRVLKARQELQGSMGNLPYLVHLHHALRRALEEPKAS